MVLIHLNGQKAIIQPQPESSIINVERRRGIEAKAFPRAKLIMQPFDVRIIHSRPQRGRKGVKEKTRLSSILSVPLDTMYKLLVSRFFLACPFSPVGYSSDKVGYANLTIPRTPCRFPSHATNSRMHRTACPTAVVARRLFASHSWIIVQSELSFH
jgi:hypothetical protein